MLQKKMILLLGGMFFAIFVYPQQVLVDSVEKQLKTELPDSVRLMSMVRLAMYYENIDIAKAHSEYAEARALADKKNMPLYKGLSYRYEASLYNYHLQYPEMLSNLDKAGAIYTTLTSRKALNELSAVYADYASYYSAKNDEKKAAEYGFKAAAIQEKNGFKTNLVTTYLNLASLFQRMGQMDEQKDYTSRSLVLAKELKNTKYLFTAYLFKANYFDATQQHAAALVYLDSAKPYINATNEINTLQIYYAVRASAFLGLKQYDSAAYYYHTGYNRAIQYNLGWYKIDLLLKIGYVYLLQKKYGPSEKYLNMGLSAAIKDSLVLFQKEGYESLSRVYAETNRYKEAYENYKTFHSLTDSLVGTEKKKYTLDLETKYETEKKEQEIKTLEAEKNIQQLQLKQKSILNYLLIAAAVVSLLIGFIFYRNYQHKQSLQQQRIAELEKERQLTATEAVLQGEEQERARLARDLHDGLSGMLSGAKYSLQTMKGNLIMTSDNQQSFERGMDMLDSSIKEMRRVAQNLMPEALIHFGLDTALKDYCTEINKNGIIAVVYQSMGMDNNTIVQTTAIAIYRIIQELTNNVIKHAGASQVLVQLLHEGDKLVINVEDNGKGIDEEEFKKANGMGWKNIRSRIEYLKGKSDIQSEPGKGTAVNIEINLAA